MMEKYENNDWEDNDWEDGCSDECHAQDPLWHDWIAPSQQAYCCHSRAPEGNNAALG